MPTYEYLCKSCGERLEVQQAFTDDALTECPTCQGALRKVFGNVGISFKGSGFYKTDNRSSSKRPTTADGSSKSEASSTSDSSSSTSDSSSSSASSDSSSSKSSSSTDKASSSTTTT